MDQVLNFLMVEGRIRPHNYRALVMLWVLHKYRYFMGTEAGTSEQRRLLVKFCKEVCKCCNIQWG